MEKTEKKYVWALMDELGATEKVFASLDDEAIFEIASIVFEEGGYDCDEELPDSVEVVASDLREYLQSGEEEIEFDGTSLILMKVELNVDLESGDRLVDDPDFEVRKGAVVREAALRMSLGCAMDVVLVPVAFCTREIDLTDMGVMDWVEHTLA